MLMKTKEEGSDILTNATMLRKTNGLLFLPHDMYENKGSYLKPQGENGDGGARKIALALLRRATQNSKIQAGRYAHATFCGMAILAMI